MTRPSRFEGTIGRTLAESDAVVADPPHPGDAAPNVVVDPARRHRLRPLRLLRLRHRHAEHRPRSPPTGCATPTSTSRRCARRRAPRCSPAATTTRSACAACRNCNTGFPHMRGAHLRPRGDRGRGAARRRLRDVRRRQVAPRADGGRARPPARIDQWPLPARLRPLLRLPRGRDRPVPPRARLRQPPRSTRPAGPRTATTCREDLVDQAMRLIRDTAVDPARPAVLPLPRRSAPRTRRTRRRAEYLREVPRPLRRRAGTSPRERVVRAPARARASSPRAPTLAPAQPRRRAVGRPAREPAAPRRAACRRRSPRSSTTPTRRSAGSSTASTQLGELDNTMLVVLSDNGASQEGGPFGVMHEMKFFNGILETPDEAVEPPRRHRRPAQPHQLPVGLGAGRQHAVQVVQAEHPRGRRARAADRALARRHRRRAARHHARPVPSTSSTSCRPIYDAARRDAAADVPRARADAGDRARRSRSTLRRRRRAGRPSTLQYFEMMRQPRRLARTGGRRSRSTRQASRSTTTEWELYHLGRRPLGVPRPRGGRARQAGAS